MLEKKLAGAIPVLQSSNNVEKISLLLKGLIPLAVVLLAHFEIGIDAEDLSNLVKLGIGAGSAIAVFVGAVRKVAYSLKK